MDPDAALVEISDNLGTFWNPSTPPSTRLVIAEHIIEHVQALHEWLLKGGHLPSDWEVSEQISRPQFSSPQFAQDDLGDVSEGKSAPNYERDEVSAGGRTRLVRTRPCSCECNSGGFCGGCGHAGCGLR